MRKVVWLLSLLLVFIAQPARAQSDTPRGELFVGYSYLRGDFGQRHGNLSAGAQVEAAANLNRLFGLVGAVSTHHGDIRGANVDHQLFLFGPRVSLRTWPVTPFVHGLFGFHRTRVGFPGTFLPGTDDTGFSFAIGTGVDRTIGPGLAWRLVQADYVSPDITVPTTRDQFVDNIRLSSGLVFRWGGR